ncbi:response regulator [Bosea sp. (in: a-proteobacteria)]|jgi:CheY-like chemotaxis protein|uniref:response regulator n=1 Tax=Bosea sp. (in: a-proteobacteria) TaxID=1871050 RepID=UPI00356A1CE5
MPQIVVLIVDDEPLIRMDLADMVRDAGYVALEAAHADEAIRLLESQPTIRILVTDIEMPGSMDGLKLAAAVRERWPPVAIIVTSGRILPANTALPEATAFLAKPYDGAAMEAALRKAAEAVLRADSEA